MKPKVCILRSDGTNCEEELFYAFEKFGAFPTYVHVNELRSKSQRLKTFQILALPGGFSYGDDVASGKILAIELVSFLKDQLQEFINRKGIILGVCNGFQALVRTGLLPFNNLGKMDATLSQNESGHFECRWVKIRIESCASPIFKPFVGEIIDVAVNHGEGRFYALANEINNIEEQKLVFCRYVDEANKPTRNYPQNPNGAINAIAGITDPTGRIIGLMPHPEKIVDITQHPNWRRGNVEAKGGLIFKSIINFANQS